MTVKQKPNFVKLQRIFQDDKFHGKDYSIVLSLVKLRVKCLLFRFKIENTIKGNTKILNENQFLLMALCRTGFFVKLAIKPTVLLCRLTFSEFKRGLIT